MFASSIANLKPSQMEYFVPDASLSVPPTDILCLYFVSTGLYVSYMIALIILNNSKEYRVKIYINVGYVHTECHIYACQDAVKTFTFYSATGEYL